MILCRCGYDSITIQLQRVKRVCKPTADWLKIYEEEKASGGHARAEIEKLMNPSLPEMYVEEEEITTNENSV